MYVDNRYTSLVLFTFLQSRKTGVVGSVWLCRRHMPKDLQVKQQEDVDYQNPDRHASVNLDGHKAGKHTEHIAHIADGRGDSPWRSSGEEA